MKIVVCLKQVPDAKSVRFDREKGTLIREGVDAVINPYDLCALEMALQLKDRAGASVTVVSMGPPQAEEALREAMARGADEGILLCDRAFAGSDTLATTYALALAVEKMGRPDLVLCGKLTTDGDTAQVGPGLAVRLGLPCVTCVDEIRAVEGQSLRIKRIFEDGYDVVEVDMPALLTVQGVGQSPRLPSLKGKMRAKKAEVPVWTAGDLGAVTDDLGLPGSPTRLETTWVPEFGGRHEILEGDLEEQVAALVSRLKTAGVV